MKSKAFLLLVSLVTLVCAYTQSDLLSAQYTYQTINDKLSEAKKERKSASQALAKAKSNLQEAQENLKDSEKKYQDALLADKNSEPKVAQTTKEFSLANDSLNKIWNNLNPK